MKRSVALLVVWAFAALPSAHAQNWVDSIFPERSFDLGTVARGSKVHHVFPVVNRSGYDLHIASWKPKCGCTSVQVGARDIPPGTQTTIDAVIDTTNFQGYKPSGLTLTIDRPYYTEVELNLSCFIRTDLVLSPGQVDFGIIQRSASSKPAVSLNLTYAGGIPNWGIVKMVTQTNNVSAKLQEQGRSADGQVHYLLTATLNPSAANGFFKDQITLVTNDQPAVTIPVSVSANIQAAVTVSPSILNLGRVKPGETVDKTVIVRSNQPFKVTGVSASKDDLSGNPDPEGARPVHTVKLKFKAPTQPGPYNAVFEIATDLKDEPPAKLMTFATIAP